VSSHSRFAGLLFSWLLLCSTASAFAAQPVYHQTIKNGSRALPGKVLVVTPDVHIYEVTAGGVVEKLAQRSDDAVKRFQSSLRKFADEHTVPIEVVPLPETSEDEKEQVAEFVAQYSVVSSAALAAMTGGAAWKDKVDHFDYSVGFGLGFLKARSGADAVLVCSGSARTASTGRMTMSLLTSVLIAVASGGAYAPMRNDDLAEVSMGLVDLDTGDILWTRSDATGPKVLEDDSANYAFVKSAVEAYFADSKR